MRRLGSNLFQILAGIIVGAALAILATAYFNPSAFVCPQGRGLVCVTALFEP